MFRTLRLCLFLILSLPVLAMAQPQLSGFSINPNPAYGGGKATGTVTLNGAAPTGGTAVAISSNTSVLTMPSSVTVPAGQSTTTFQITIGHIGSPATRQVFAKLGAFTKTVNLTLWPGLKSVIVNPNEVTGGSPTQGQVVLWGPAPAGIHINVSSNSSVVIPPAIVTIDQGNTTATFEIVTKQVGADATRIVSASLAGATRTAIIKLTAQPRLASVVLSSNTILGGNSVNGTVTLTGVATGPGRFVQMSENSTKAHTAANASVAQGTSSGQFTVDTQAVSAVETVTITAKMGGVTKTTTLTLMPPQSLMSLTVNPNSVEGGQSTNGTVTLSSTANGAKSVTLTDNSSVLTTPPTVTVPSGQTSAAFQIGTSSVTATAVRQVTATLNGISRTANVTVRPAPRVVNIQGSAFNARDITVSPGMTVRWVNNDFLQHTVTRDRTDIAGPDSPVLGSSDTYEWTVPLNMPKGTDVYYHCVFHGGPGDGTTFGIGMTGVVRVR